MKSLHRPCKTYSAPSRVYLNNPASLFVYEPPLIEGVPELSDNDDAPDLYEVKIVIAHVQDQDSPAGHLLYQVKWFRYAERT